jgi:hypothetical protein
MSEEKTKKPRKVLTAREKAAKALADYNKYIVEAEAEGIVDVVKTTNIVAEYNKMRKDGENKDVADYVILAAIAKAVGAKGVEITKKKTPIRKKPDPNAPKKEKSTTATKATKASKEKTATSK